MKKPNALSGLHRKCEIWFEILTTRIYRWKYVAIAAVIMVTLALASQLPKITVDTRDESFFHPNDPALRAYNRFRDMFGQDDIFIVAMKPQHGLDLSFFQRLRRIHKDLEGAVPYLDEITSLINARIVRAEGDLLLVEGLMDRMPRNTADLDHILNLVDRYPLYENLLVSKDRTMAYILIKGRSVVEMSEAALLEAFDAEDPEPPSTAKSYLSNDQYVEIDAVIQEVIDGHRDSNIEFYLSGTPAFVAAIQKGIEKDMKAMVPLSFGVIIFFLFLLFRRVSGVLYPLATVALSLIASLGLMALVGIPVTNAIGILPTFLIVVGIGDSVHILTIFYRIHGRINDKRRAIIQAVGFAGLPVLMTSITTACGLFSFAWADVAIIAQLGYIASAGVMLAFFYTVVLLPALVAIFPAKAISLDGKGHHRVVDRFFAAIARMTTRHPIGVVCLSAVVLVVAAYGALTVRFSHNALTWLPEESSIRRSTQLLDRVNGGTVMLDVTVDSHAPNGLCRPDLLLRLDEAAAYLPTLSIQGIQAGTAWSMADVLKEINRALHQDDPKAYVLPTNRNMVAQQLVLFESSGSDDMEELVDSTYQIGRLSLMAPFAEAIRYKVYVDKVKTYLNQQFPEELVTLTGHIPIFVEIIGRFITSMAKSYTIALVVITLLMVLIIGRLGVGLLSMVANVLPVVCVFGIMGYFNVPVDMATILIGSLVLGLVVDDTIHFLHHFRKAFDETGDVRQAVQETFFTTGRALVITSLVLSGGFFIYTASFLASNARFGWLTACAVLLALAADFFVVPALLSMIYGGKGDKKGRNTASVESPLEAVVAGRKN